MTFPEAQSGDSELVAAESEAAIQSSSRIALADPGVVADHRGSAELSALGRADDAVIGLTGAQSGLSDRRVEDGLAALGFFTDYRSQLDTAPLITLDELPPAPPTDAPVLEDGMPPRPGGVSKPMIVFAALAGLVLVSTPFAIKNMFGQPVAQPHRSPAMLAFGADDGGQPGFVPAAETEVANSPAGALSAAPNGTVAPVAAPASVGQPVAGGYSPAAVGGAAAGGSAAAPPQAQHPASSSGQHPVAGPTAARAAAAVALSYTGEAGPSCSDPTTGATKVGYYTDGQSGWTNSSGADGSNGCAGQYDSLPMSGDATKDDGNHFIWSFRTGKVTTGTCTVSVFIPNSSDIKKVGGDPAYYTVYGASGINSGNWAGSFDINQIKQHGWVSVGSFKVGNGNLTVELHTRGQDWVGNTKTYAHLAAAQVRASCAG